MNPKHPIYIISKDRPRCITARTLDKLKVPYKIVIEPQQLEEYKEHHDKNKFLLTPFQDLGKGSIPVRNWVWEHSKEAGDKRHWILDDSIEEFKRLNRNTKIKVRTGAIFRAAEDFVKRYRNVPLAGMNYVSFAKATDKLPPFYLNTRVYSCMLIHNDLKIRWRGKYNEDTDLSLRVLKMGYCTILFNAFLCGKVTTYRMKGGNTSIYDETNNRKEFVESLIEQHPDVVKLTKKFGRYHHQVNYKSFKENNKLIKKFPDKKYSGINEYGMVLKENCTNKVVSE